MPRLRRVDCNSPGIARVRRGRGFAYAGPGGEPIADPQTRERIEELAIPPAWREVWICPDPRGHIQATGHDAAGRTGGGWIDVKSEEINAHLGELAGGEFTAKDFRTWNATVLAAVELAARAERADSKTGRARAAREVVRAVAEQLGNTPAVARSSYIDPRLFDRFDAGETIGAALRRAAARAEPGEFPDRERIERAVLRLLRIA